MAHVSDYWLCIGVSIWTIVQTIVHVWWILHGRKLFSCHYKIQQKVQLYIYYTYLYSNECDNSPVIDYIVNKQDTPVIFPSFTNTSENIFNLELFFQRDVILYPFYEKQTALTNKLMLFNIITDAIWFVSSISLLVGAIFKLKEWTAVIFFTPWIVVDVIVLILDLFGAIYFGLQIRKTESNITRSALQLNLESIDIPNSAVMAIVSGRLGIIWVINCLLFVFVLRATLRTSKKRYSDERSRHNTSAEARIKNWQQFYGVIDNDGGIGNENGNEEAAKYDAPINYSSTFKDFKEQKNTEGDNLSSTLKSSRGSLKMCKTPSASGILRGQLPWSYTQNTDAIQRDVPKALVENKSKLMTIAPTMDEQASRF